MTLSAIAMLVPVTLKPSVLKGKLPVVEKASMMASRTVTSLPISCVFQAIGLRDLKCCSEPLVALKLRRRGRAAMPVLPARFTSHQACLKELIQPVVTLLVLMKSMEGPANLNRYKEVE